MVVGRHDRAIESCSASPVEAVALRNFRSDTSRPHRTAEQSEHRSAF